MSAEALSRRESPRGFESAIEDPEGAWSAYEPDAALPWNLPRAAHLHRRAAFGASARDLSAALAVGPRLAVDAILRPQGDLEAFERTTSQLEAKAVRGDSVESLRAWWLRRMLESPFPLREKMTLFWHGTLGIGNARVKDATALRTHLALLRAHALGSYETLLEGVLRDPATLTALGAKAGRRARPPVELARVLLARYTVGPGAFDETDVREAARALAGRFILRGEVRDLDRERDDGVKRILGKEGRFDAQGLLRLLLADPRTARTLVRRLWREFISEAFDPPDRLLDPLIRQFAADPRVGPLVERILRSRVFFSASAYRARVKSPVAFALGLARSLEVVPATGPLGSRLSVLGQSLVDPPTTEGWLGGEHWMGWWSAAARANLAREFIEGGESAPAGADPVAAAAREDPPSAGVDLLFRVLLDGECPPATRARLLALGGIDGELGSASRDALRRLAWCVACSSEYPLD